MFRVWLYDKIKKLLDKVKVTGYGDLDDGSVILLLRDSLISFIL